MEDLDRAEHRMEVGKTGDSICIPKPPVASERTFHVLVRKMPRLQGLTGIKLTGQPVSPRDHYAWIFYPRVLVTKLRSSCL